MSQLGNSAVSLLQTEVPVLCLCLLFNLAQSVCWTAHYYQPNKYLLLLFYCSPPPPPPPPFSFHFLPSRLAAQQSPTSHTSLLSAQVPLLTLPLSPEAPHPFHIHLLCSVLALFCCQLLLLHHFRLHSSPLFNSTVCCLLLHPFTVVPGIQTVILSTRSLFRQRVPV